MKSIGINNLIIFLINLFHLFTYRLCLKKTHEENVQIPPLSLAVNSVNTPLNFPVSNPYQISSINNNPNFNMNALPPNQFSIPPIPIQSILPPGKLISPGIIGNYNEPDFSENKVCPEQNTCISCQNALYNLKFRENGQCEFNKCLNKVSFINYSVC